MVEYYSESLVLDKEPISEVDGLVHLYTQNFGKISVRARSLRKILSKSNAHLEPLNFVKIRFVSGRSGNFQLIDALSFNSEVIGKIKTNSDNLQKFHRIINFLKDMTLEMHPDLFLWQVIKEIIKKDFEEAIAYKLILSALGFDPRFAQCYCGSKEISFFHKKDHSFFCEKCGSKLAKNEVIYIK